MLEVKSTETKKRTLNSIYFNRGCNCKKKQSLAYLRQTLLRTDS